MDPTFVHMMSRTALVLTLAMGLFAASPASAQSAIMLERPSDDPPVPRLRIGGEFGGGIGYGATDGGTLGGFGHLGAQITRELGVFLQGALVGYGFGGPDMDYDKFLAWQNSAMVDLTVRNVAQLGFGGGFDLGKFVYCEDRSGACTQYGRSVNPSLSLRVAFLVAFPRHNARWGIPIALHAHIMLWEHRPQSHLMLTVGFSRY